MSKSALIVIDMLNHYDHKDSEKLRRSVRQALPAIKSVVSQAAATQTPVAYVNDNHGDWAAGRTELCERALNGSARDLVEPILPTNDVAFLVKARHSIFYETQLDYMLRRQGIERIILIGQVTEQCILYSALDAYVRHYSITVPRDAVCHIHEDLADSALRMMEINMAADITSAAELNWD
jgi:nicotinamidase-related amidase